MGQYIHQKFGAEVQFIAGYYTILEEGRMGHGGKEFLYAVGMAIVDNACCGRGGCRFLHVPGYIVSWKEKESADGLPVSEVEPICNETDQREIRNLLEDDFPHAQVIFL
ncbi:MAG: hypothetical protein QMD03_06055 [Syntrophales bacterium]|nr:hypothetical protein [Syntrophales bacterium]